MGFLRLRKALLIPLCVALTVIVAVMRWVFSAPPDVPSILPENSLVRTFVPEALLVQPFLEPGSVQLNRWSSQGSVLTRNNEFVRLVPDRLGMAGLVFAKQPMQDASFEMLTTFHLHTSGSRRIYGDGLAMWILDKPSVGGEVFGAGNHFKGLGIFVDTYRNGHRGHFPYINVMLGDGNLRYDKNKDGYDTRLDGCMAGAVVDPKEGKSVLRVRYLSSGHLQIDVDSQGTGDFKNCVTRMGVFLPESKFFGFSAETGLLSHAVDIISSSVESLRNEDGSSVESDEQWDSSSPRGTRTPEYKSTNKRTNLAARLRARERKVEQEARARRLEKYGDPDLTFIRRVRGAILTTLRWSGILTLIVMVAWIARLFHRTWKQKRKTSRGLLD